MRKLIWCSLAAGVMATSGFLSLAYYACCCPASLVGRAMQVIAEASVAMQPLSGLTSMAMRTNTANETAAPLDANIPNDPQPIPFQRKEDVMLGGMRELEQEAAPIVIHEDEPPAIVLNERNFEAAEVPPAKCPIVMPYCRDDEEEPASPSKRDRADSGQPTEQSVFKAWMELFAEGNKEKSPAVEQLPPPAEEEAEVAPKCQEDRHLHEHYPGCPHTTGLHPGKSKLKKKGGEESSEEPHPSNDCKDKEECPRTKGVDTMEYRKSDAGLDEYGPAQVH